MKGGGALAPPNIPTVKDNFLTIFWRGRLNKYDELGTFFLFRAVEGLIMNKLHTLNF